MRNVGVGVIGETNAYNTHRQPVDIGKLNGEKKRTIEMLLAAPHSDTWRWKRITICASRVCAAHHTQWTKKQKTKLLNNGIMNRVQMVSYWTTNFRSYLNDAALSASANLLSHFICEIESIRPLCTSIYIFILWHIKRKRIVVVVVVNCVSTQHLKYFITTELKC